MLWGVPDLSPSAVPQMRDGEKVLLSVDHVGLYDGETKSADHQSGTAYVTTQRLIYVDFQQPVLHSIQAEIAQIKETAYTPGFLKASPRITVSIADIEDNPAGNSVEPQENWVCSICSFSNPANSTKCITCGVTAQEDTVLYRSNTTSVSLSPGECPQCTFQNHPSIKFCEMCGASLRQVSNITPSIGKTVKVSFRQGNSHKFWDVLQRARNNIKPEDETTLESQNAKAGSFVGAFGIHRLVARNQQLRVLNDDVLNRALANPETLKGIVSEVIQIAEGFSAGHNSFSARPLPVIQASTNTPEALARQIVDLLVGEDEILANAGGMLTLHDAFKVFNRCLGFATVSPRQFLSALKICETLDLPLRVRAFPSGLRVVETRGALDQAIQRIVYWISTETSSSTWREGSGFSARDVSGKFGYTLQVAMEELVLAEQRGKLCRDEHASGLRFFPNLFQQSS